MVSAIEIKPDQPDSDETNNCNIVSQAYDKLFKLIRSDLLVNPSLVKMPFLICALLTGNTEITTQYPYCVRRLVNSFGQAIIYGVI